MHLCHAEECITSVCFAALFLILSLFLVQYLSHNLGHTPPHEGRASALGGVCPAR